MRTRSSGLAEHSETVCGNSGPEVAARGPGERKYQALLESLPQKIAFKDRNSVYISCNENYSRDLHIAPDEVVGKTDYDFFPREFAEKYRLDDQQVMQTGEVKELEEHYIVDGKVVWVNTVKKPVRDDRGEVCGVLVIFWDITERKRMEQERAYLASIVECSDDAIIGKSLDGVIQTWNLGAARLYGYVAEEVIGQSIALLIPPDRAGELTTWLGQIRRGEQVVQHETVRLRKDGRRVDVSVSISPVRDADRRLIGVSSITRDMTEQKRASEKLRESEEQLRLAVSATELGTWDFNPVTGVLQWSDLCKQLFGLPPDAVVNYQTFLDRLHPGDRQPTDDVVQRSLDPTGTGEYDIEYRALWPDGTLRWIAATGKASFGDVDGKKQATRFIGTVRDITQRKRAEEEIRNLNTGLERRVAERTAELVAANKELEAFSYSVSHDLRAPLRAMDGFCQALLEDYGDRLDSEGKNHLQRVQAASQRMDQLIDGILELSRTGRSEMNRDRVDLSRLAQTIDLELRRMNPDRVVDFAVAPSLVAYADANLLRVVLENLLGNAWKYTSRQPHARIELGTVQHNGETAYFVSDDGAGFDMAYANRLFGPFQRLHSPTEFAGTGIGLATVQRIIHRHGGQVWAEGEVGKGATFFFTLAKESEMRG